jgi:hypothetical protein
VVLLLALTLIPAASNLSVPAATMAALVFPWLCLDDRAQYLGPPAFEVHVPLQSAIQQTFCDSIADPSRSVMNHPA